MRTRCRLLLLTLLVTGLSSAAQKDSPQTKLAPLRYYVQLIWGTNREKPEHATFRPVGPKLRSELSRVFQWQRYWEVNRQAIELGGGKSASIRLSPECEVQIDLSSPGSRETRIYGKGILVARSRQKAECHAMTVHGAAIETGGSWFVVVREDAPKDD
jgi:hypothetical protein